MYNSGVTILAFISRLNSETDIASPISNDVYTKWINVVQQILYGELIEQYKAYEITTVDDIELSDIIKPQNEAEVIYDDVYKVYVNGEELTRADVTTALSIPDKEIYYYNGSVVKIHCNYAYENATVVYRVRPNISTETSEYIYLPYEWIEMLAAKIRGEAYKLANDDNMSAKWLADYNMQLESFKIWIAKRNKKYGE